MPVVPDRVVAKPMLTVWIPPYKRRKRDPAAQHNLEM
jgi:hypothetical protein